MKNNIKTATKVANIMVNKYANMLIVEEKTEVYHTIRTSINNGFKNFHNSNMQDIIHNMLIDILIHNNIEQWFIEQNEIFYNYFMYYNETSLSLTEMKEACQELNKLNKLTNYNEMLCNIVKLQVKQHMIDLVKNIIQTMEVIINEEVFNLDYKDIDLIDVVKRDVSQWLNELN